MTEATLEASESTEGLDLLSALWSPAFPSPELLSEAAALMPSERTGERDGGGLAEGPQWRVSIAPGAVSVRCQDYAKSERRYERQVKARRVDTDAVAAHFRRTGELPTDPEPTREVTGWSRKSRANMVETLCQLDYSPLLKPGRAPAMATLTYPKCWTRVAPNGDAVKEHLKSLGKRWKRAWGESLACIWKLEFQARQQFKWYKGLRESNWCTCSYCDGVDDGRAPHFHLLVVPPHGKTAGGETFQMWLSRVWAEIVNHPDPEEKARHRTAGTRVDFSEGLRSTDPKRVAVYFTKHGAFSAKDYQHIVPELWRKPGEGPGRFWGYWKLEKCVVTLEISPRHATMLARTIRRWARAQGTTRQVTRERVDTKTGRIYYRKTRVRVKRMGAGRGFVSVNNGAHFASQLARALEFETTEVRGRFTRGRGVPLPS